jgi:calnexin
VQYEVRFQQAVSCGGSYAKLLSHTASLNLKQLEEKTPYTILFGPDKLVHL